MPSPDVISIASGPFSARICPAWGGRMTHLAHAQFGDILVPTTADTFEPWTWPKAGAYPLFPYHNRIYGASFVHAGIEHKVLPHPALGADAIHGPAHRRPWRVTSKTEKQVVLSLAYEADDEWPFAFEAQQSFVLDPTGLSIKLTMTNRSEVPAPAAIGWHPYFAADFTCKASTDAELAYPLDEFDVPTGAAPFRRDTSTLPAMSGYTKHFTRWSKAEIVRKDGLSLIMEADHVLGHLAAHRTEKYICLEPVSMASGTLNVPEQQRSHFGLKILTTGESLAANIRLCV
jgi:aldose 1-epimerase